MPIYLVQLKRCWTKRTSLNDNTSAMLLYFIQTFPPCVSVQPIAGAGKDSGHDQAWQTTPLFLIYRGEKNVHALVLLIRDVLFDVVAFIGLEMPISHSTTHLWSENSHLVTHFPENQVGKNKSRAEIQQYLTEKINNNLNRLIIIVYFIYFIRHLNPSEIPTPYKNPTNSSLKGVLT